MRLKTPTALTVSNEGETMTEDDVQCEITCENSDAYNHAQDEYTRKTGKELRAQCHRLTDETAKRYALIMKGKAPFAFGEFDRDVVARILNTDVYVNYDGYEFDTSVDLGTIECWQDAAVDVSYTFMAEETWDRWGFIEAYRKYMYTAAAFAKSIGADHAMRLYLRACGIMDRVIEHDRAHAWYSAEEALHVVNLERVATERLWVDVEAAKLPKFKPQRKNAPRGKSKSAKPRKGKG